MEVAPEGVEGAIGKPPRRLRRGETLCPISKMMKKKIHLPPQPFAFFPI